MKKKDIRNLLAQHVDSLVQGEDETDELLEQYSESDDQVASLFSLATSLKEVLVPVVTVPSYRRYWESLSDYPTQGVIIRQRKRTPVLWLVIAIIGALLSLVSIIIVVLRYMRFSERRQTNQSPSVA